MKESTLQKHIIEWLRAKGAYVANIYGSGMTGKGTADLLVCYKGMFIAVECKVKNNKLSPAQEIQRKRVLSAGGTYIVPYTLEQFIDEFGAVTDGKTICNTGQQ